MAARKTTRSRTRSRREATLDRLERELPANLRDFSQQLRGRLGQLEKEIERASLDARRSAARLLREGSLQLGRLEARGESGWRKLAEPARKELVRLLRRIEKAVKPAAPRRKATRARARRPATAAEPPPPPPA